MNSNDDADDTGDHDCGSVLVIMMMVMLVMLLVVMIMLVIMICDDNFRIFRVFQGDLIEAF